MDLLLEAKRLFRISFRKLENMQKTTQRVSQSLHNSVVINNVFNRALTYVHDVEVLGEDIQDATGTSALDTYPLDPVVNNSAVNGTSVEPEYVQLDHPLSAANPIPSVIPDSRNSANFEGHSPAPSVPEQVVLDGENDQDNRRDRLCLKRAAEFECDKSSFKRLRYIDNNSDDDDSDEEADKISSWRAHADFSDMEDESDPDPEVDGQFPCNMSFQYWDENAMVNKPTVEGPQISSLVTVFSSSFNGLGDFGACADDSALVKQRYYSLNGNIALGHASLRRVHSMPNLCAKPFDSSGQPKPKKKKTGPVVIRI